MRLATLSVLLGLELSGCANWNSIHHEFDLAPKDGTHAVSIDVKQRAILSRTSGGRTVTCAEPSPDALTVIASGVNGSAGLGNSKTLDFGGAQTETGAFIGNRTATIQLLRDNLYRACESYMAGAINEDKYHNLLTRYQVMTMGLLAIEQLTEASKPPPIVISAGSAATSQVSPTRLNESRDAVVAAKADVDARKAQVDEQTSKLDKAKTDLDSATDKKAAQEAVDKAEAALKQAQDAAKKAQTKAELVAAEYEEAKGGAGLSTKLSGGSLLSAQQAASARTVPFSELATATKNIVEIIVDHGFKLDACFNSSDKSICSASDIGSAATDAATACFKVSAESGATPEALRACAKPSLDSAGVTLNTLKDNTTFISEASAQLSDQQKPDGPPSSKAVALRQFAKVLVPNAGKDKIRVDVFALPQHQAQQQKVIAQLKSEQFAEVRPRDVSEAECTNKFYIDPKQTATIRYDADSNETQFVPVIRSAIHSALGVPDGQVSAGTVNTPTPLYISVFLCGK